MIEISESEQIAQHYRAAMMAVETINSTKPENVSDEDWADEIERNKLHLQIMLAKDFWTTEDLTPLQEAAQ